MAETLRDYWPVSGHGFREASPGYSGMAGALRPRHARAHSTAGGNAGGPDISDGTETHIERRRSSDGHRDYAILAQRKEQWHGWMDV